MITAMMPSSTRRPRRWRRTGEQPRADAEHGQPQQAGGEGAGGEGHAGVVEAVRQRADHHHVQPEMRVQQRSPARPAWPRGARARPRAPPPPPFALRRVGPIAARTDRKATPNHSTAVVSQGNQVVRACRPDTLAKMKTASISAQMATTLAVRAHQALAQDERALRAHDGEQAQPGGRAAGPGGEEEGDDRVANMMRIPLLLRLCRRSMATNPRRARGVRRPVVSGGLRRRRARAWCAAWVFSSSSRPVPAAASACRNGFFVLGRLAMKRGVGARRRAGMMNCRLPAT